MVHELCSTQEIYYRAVSHFIYKSTKNYYIATSNKECHQDLCAQENMCYLRKRDSVKEFLDDYEYVLRDIFLADTPDPFKSENRSLDSENINDLNYGEGLCTETWSGIFFPVDFSSALIELNKSVYSQRELSNEVRRKQIFCTDQVMP